MIRGRIAALLAIVLAIVSLALAVVAAVAHFPRGLIVLGCIGVALIAGWNAILRRGAIRAVGIAVAIAAVAAALLLLLTRDPIVIVLAVLTGLGALAASRSAFSAHAELALAPAPSRPVLFVNPRSGGGKAERFHLVDEARKRGIEAVELTPGAGLGSLVEAALERGADALAMAGGDGSQAVVAAAAARVGIPYACIPSGTRNHFALDLGVDRDDVVGALDALVTGGERLVDLAEVNGHVFVNNVSLGLYAEAVQSRGYRNAKLRTLLDTVPDLAGPSAHAPAIRWSGPEQIKHSGGLALLVSNNPYRLGRAIGSGTRPRMDTGDLGVAVVEPEGQIRKGLMELWSGPSLEVDSDQPLPAGIDGESVVLDPPLRFVTRPGALRVRVSAQHPGQSPSAAIPASGRASLIALGRLAFTGRRTSSGRGDGPRRG